MHLDQQKIETLFAKTCDRIRVSPRQTSETIVRESRRRLARDPGDTEAMHVLAAHSLLRKEPEKSFEILNRQPERLPCDAVGNRLAGYAALADNNRSAARDYLGQSVRLDPSQTDCWTLLGHIANEAGETNGAIRFYERAILFDERDHESAIALSRLHARQGNLLDAIHTLRVCILRDRRSAKLNLGLAKLLRRRAAMLKRRQNPTRQQKLLEEALACYRIVNASAPTSRSWVAQGQLQRQLGRYDEALKSFEAAVDADPRSALAITHLAHANVDAGNIEEALTQFERALSINPRQSDTHFRYCRAKKFKPGRETDEYADQLRTLLRDERLNDHAHIHLNFALAKVLDDTKQYDESWECYDRANRRKMCHSDSTTTRQVPAPSKRMPLEQLVTDSRELFSAGASSVAGIDGNYAYGSLSEVPVFIIGMPRSGTTLTEQILSSHPEIAGAGELQAIERIRHACVSTRRNANHRSNACGEGSQYPKLLKTMDSQELAEHAHSYLTTLDSFRTSEVRVTDKMPTNFIHLGLIAMLFPNARVIHCRRNPMDVVTSCYCQNLNAPFCDLQQLVHYYRNYRTLMKHWESVLPLKIHSVDYESLVADPEEQSRKLIAHCGLDWDPKCLDFHTSDRAVHTPSKWQVRQPMYTSSLEKWRRFEKQLEPVASQLRDLME